MYKNDLNPQALLKKKFVLNKNKQMYFFYQLLYKHRLVIERTNVKILLKHSLRILKEIKKNLKSLNLWAFIVILLR